MEIVHGRDARHLRQRAADFVVRQVRRNAFHQDFHRSAQQQPGRAQNQRRDEKREERIDR